MPPVGRNARVSMGLVDRIDCDFSSHSLGVAKGEYGYHGHDGQTFYGAKERKVMNPLYLNNTSV
jgi:hypothetical protein